jgi:hypothetical protein
VAAFQTLWRFSEGTGKVFAYLYNSKDVVGAREWFALALSRAGVTNFHWRVGGPVAQVSLLRPGILQEA